MNDIIDCIIPFLHLSNSSSVFNKLCLVNKQFNKEYKDKLIITTYDNLFSNLSPTHYEKPFGIILTNFLRENNTFHFKIILKLFYDDRHYNAKFTINNGFGVLSLDSGVYMVKPEDIVFDEDGDGDSDDDYDGDDDDEDDGDDDETFETFQNFDKSLNSFIKTINRLIWNQK